jgi:hypothetical protein
MWDYEILYADRSWKDEQLYAVKVKEINVVAGWKLKFIFCSMETTHELLHSDKWS